MPKGEIIQKVAFLLSDRNDQIEFVSQSGFKKTDYDFKFDVNSKVRKVGAKITQYENSHGSYISGLLFYDSDDKVCFDTTDNI